MIRKKILNGLVQVKVILMTDHYLYSSPNGEIEVRATGRFVEKKLTMSNTTQILIEITPVDNDLHWTKFIDKQELLLIKSINEITTNKL